MKNTLTLLLFAAFAALSGCRAGEKPGETGPAIMAYYMPRGDDFNPDTLQLGRLTHIIYSFTEVIDNEMMLRDEQRGMLVRKLSDQKSKYPGLKVMVACGGWGGSGGFSEMARTPKTREKFVESVVKFINEYNLDGLDIDWEYPGLPGAGNPYIPEDRENFTALMKELRHALDRTGRSQTLTFAAAGWQRYFDHVDLAEVMKYADFMNLMTYDLAGGGDKFTSHHTNLGKVTTEDLKGTPAAEIMKSAADTTRPWSVEEIVSYCREKGVKPSQMVVGAAFYGKGWVGVPPVNDGLYQAARAQWSGRGRYNSLIQLYADSSGFARHWDSIAKAPWLYNPVDSIFITYDDKESVALKARYVKENRLGGIMFWELGGDTPGGGLLQSIHSEITGTE